MKHSFLLLSSLLFSLLLCSCGQKDDSSSSSHQGNEPSSNLPTPIEKEVTYNFKTIEKKATRINESIETKEQLESVLQIGQDDSLMISETCNDGMFIDQHSNGTYGLKFGAGKNPTGTLTLQCRYPVSKVSFHCNVYISSYQDWNTGEMIINADPSGILINQVESGKIMQDDYLDNEMTISLSSPSQEIVIQNYSLDNVAENYRVFIYDLTFTYLF